MSDVRLLNLNARQTVSDQDAPATRFTDPGLYLGSAVPLDKPLVTGTVGGWKVQSQRRGANGPVLCVRIISPDDEHLHLAFALSTSATNPRGPVTKALSDAFGAVFRNNRSPLLEQGCAEAVARVFDTGWELATTSIATAEDGLAALFTVQCAAWGLDLAEWQWWVPRMVERRVTVARVAQYAHGGLHREDAATWVLHPRRSGHFDKATDFTRAAKYHAAGWTQYDVDLLLEAMGKKQGAAIPDARWAALPPERAIAAYRVGLTPREALQMHQRGQWRRVEVLAALRPTPDDD